MKPKKSTWEGFLLPFIIATLSTAFYFQSINNELIFDDISFFFRTSVFSDYATTPFDNRPRTLPYFTFAFIQAITQSYEAQRVFNISLHCINSILVFALIRKIDSSNKDIISALTASLFFALNPVATYAVAYLVQRTILMATLFSLLSIIFHIKFIRTERTSQLILSSFFAILAMFSKEHAIFLPLVLPFFSHLSTLKNHRKVIKLCTAQFSVLAPFMAWLVIRAKEHVASANEIFTEIYIPPGDDENLWLRSAIGESKLFFEYMRLWLTPNTMEMSIDLRPPFPSMDDLYLYAAWPLLFISILAIALFNLTKNCGPKTLWLGIIYCQILFILELLTARIQEPFVLYRSYLWAPGFALIIYSLLMNAPRRIVTTFLLAFIFLFYNATSNRLESLSNSKNAWRDANAKLSAPPPHGAFRIFYNNGIIEIREKSYPAALSFFEKCERANAQYAGCFAGQSAVHLILKNYVAALTTINQAISITPKDASLWDRRGIIYEKMGNQALADESFAQSDALGGSLRSMFRNMKRQAVVPSKITPTKPAQIMLN